MGVDPCDLRRGVRTHAQHPAGQLVDELERLKIERLARTCQQRLQMLQQRRDDQFIPIAAGCVQQASAKLFDVARLGWQDIGNVIRQDPGGHVMRGLLKR